MMLTYTIVGMVVCQRTMAWCTWLVVTWFVVAWLVCLLERCWLFAHCLLLAIGLSAADSCVHNLFIFKTG